MKKYLIIDKNGEKELNEEELNNFFFEKLFNHFYENIERTYNGIKVNSTYKNYGKYYSKRPKHTNKCLIPDCCESPIYSHSISKNAVLKNIATNGFVYTPLIKNGTIVMDSVGIEKQASVFPCLCNFHDSKFFSELDKSDGMDYSMIFFEQLIHRTIFREFYVLERNIEMAEKVLVEIDLGFENVKSSMIDKFNNLLYSGKVKVHELSDSRFSITENKEHIENQINLDKSCLQRLSDFYSKEKPNRVIYTIIDCTLPVTFSGLTQFYSKDKQINLVINCLPYKDHTLFTIANSSIDDECIKRELLFKYDLEDNDSLLKLIEVLAVYGTDNIYFDMNYWNSLDVNISKKYMQEFSNFEGTDPRNEIDFSFLKWDYK